eukprot:363382-Chlamydomonas_euryale.AAC.1
MQRDRVQTFTPATAATTPSPQHIRNGQVRQVDRHARQRRDAWRPRPPIHTCNTFPAPVTCNSRTWQVDRHERQRRDAWRPRPSIHTRNTFPAPLTCNSRTWQVDRHTRQRRDALGARKGLAILHTHLHKGKLPAGAFATNSELLSSKAVRETFARIEVLGFCKGIAYLRDGTRDVCVGEIAHFKYDIFVGEGMSYTHTNVPPRVCHAMPEYGHPQAHMHLPLPLLTSVENRTSASAKPAVTAKHSCHRQVTAATNSSPRQIGYGVCSRGDHHLLPTPPLCLTSPIAPASFIAVMLPSAAILVTSG